MNAWHRLVLPYRAHWPLAAGLVMAVAAALLWLLAVHPLVLENEQLHERARLAGPRPQAAAVSDLPGERLKTYESRLPRTDAAVEAVARIHRIGTSAGVSLPSGEYRMERRADDPLVRYRLSLPVTGTYPQVRAFVIDVLRDVPAAALDDIQLRRDPAGRIEARVRFSLFLRPA